MPNRDFLTDGMPPPYDVIVIGSGPAGLTAAIYATRAALRTLVIAGTTAGGQLMITTDVENYPGFPSGVQGPELMELWRKQAERFKADFVDDNVSKVDFTKRPLIVWTSDETHEARSVIIATGANARYLGLPNEERLKGRGSVPARRVTGSSSKASTSSWSAVATPRWRKLSTCRNCARPSTWCTDGTPSGRARSCRNACSRPRT